MTLFFWFAIVFICWIFRSEEQAWHEKYETLAQYVVPRSSHKVFEDNENGLWSVVLFKRAVDDFKNAAREHKFIVRKYEASVVVDPEAKKKQITERDRQKVRELNHLVSLPVSKKPFIINSFFFFWKENINVSIRRETFLDGVRRTLLKHLLPGFIWSVFVASLNQFCASVCPQISKRCWFW